MPLSTLPVGAGEGAAARERPAERVAGRSRTPADVPGLDTHGGQVVALTLHRFALADIPWAIAQMQWSRRPLAALPGIGFHKLMGTGGGAGFSTKPNLRVWTILSTWPNARAARDGLAGAPFRAKAERALETATFLLAPLSSRGRWAGEAAFAPGADPDPRGPIAALTRATVRPAALARFWRRVPSISATIEREPEVRFMIGMGEIPYLHQVTFSIWDDVEAMARFSRRSATHGEAVRRVAEEGWFSEQLFARFRPLDALGTWNGSPTRDLIEPEEAA